LKFTVRSAALAGVFFVSRTLHRASSARRRRLGITAALACVTGAVVALMGCFEPLGWSGLETFLRLFRRVPTTNGGVLRLTATFSHANQTAAYLALLLPVAAALAVAHHRRTRVVWALLGGLIWWALMGTLSRAGVVAGSLGAIWVLVQAVRKRQRGSAGLLMAGLVLLLGFRWAIDDTFRTRFGAGSSEPSLAAAYQVPDALRLAPGQIADVPIVVRNVGSLTWTPAGVAPFHVSYHVIRDAADRSALFDGLRSPLPRVAPGQSARISAAVQAPATPGQYLLAWDLVREGVAWFSWKQVPPGMTRLVVRSVTDSAFHEHPWAVTSRERILKAVQDDPAAVWNTVGRRTLWTTAGKLFEQRSWTGWGADTFRLRYGAFLAPGRWDPRMHANNLYLELLATTGILGLATWAALLVTLFTRRPRGPSMIEGALVASLGVFTVHGVLDSFLEFYGVMGLFWIMAGACAGLDTPGPPEQSAAGPTG
jgi:hypothetical protein